MDPRIKTTDEKVLSLLRESQECVRLGQIEASIRSLDRALELEPRCAWAWAHRGDLLYVNLGRYKEAIADFDRALALEPDYAWAIAHRGAAYERLNLFDEALRDLNRALDLKPEYTWVVAMLSRVYQFLGRYEEALDALEKVVERDAPILPHWREERGLMRMILGRYEEAHRYLVTAIEEDPSDRFAHYSFTINMIYLRGLSEARPQIDKFRDEVEAIIRTSSDSRTVARSIYELGGLAAMQGDVDQALRRLEEADSHEAGLVLLSPARKRARVDPAWAGLRENRSFRMITGLDH